jgi:hypothetical protein
MPMKTTALILLSCFAILGPAQAQSLDASTLSLHPPAACKGAGRPAPRTRDTVHAEIAGTPASDIDVDGDGWCDWITSLPYPTNSQGQEYRAREAILLGTANGTRSFGNRARLKRYWKTHPQELSNLVVPDGTVGMAPPLVAYAGRDPAPYFAGFSGAFPDYWGDGDAYKVYKWNQEADAPKQVSSSEYVVVMRFWQKRYCEGKSYSNQDFLKPDYKKPDHPLEIYICAPWVTEAIQRAEHDGAGIQTFLNGRDDR